MYKFHLKHMKSNTEYKSQTNSQKHGCTTSSPASDDGGGEGRMHADYQGMPFQEGQR